MRSSKHANLNLRRTDAVNCHFVFHSHSPVAIFFFFFFVSSSLSSASSPNSFRRSIVLASHSMIKGDLIQLVSQRNTEEQTRNEETRFIVWSSRWFRVYLIINIVFHSLFLGRLLLVARAAHSHCALKWENKWSMIHATFCRHFALLLLLFCFVLCSVSCLKRWPAKKTKCGAHFTGKLLSTKSLCRCDSY